jgi:predicted O-methyltransferase YrrM
MTKPRRSFAIRAVRGLTRLTGFKLARLGSSEFRAFTELFVPPYDRLVDWNSGLGDSAYVLYAMVRALRPEVITEIGSARGRSTCTLALACRQNGRGRVYAIDPQMRNLWTDGGTEGDNERFLRDRLRAYGLEDWCEVMRMTSAEAAARWSKPIDLLFIDGDHTFEGVQHDFNAFQPWLTNKALVVFHDTAWEYFKGDPWYRPDIGVPAYMHELQKAGYNSVTFAAMPGLTILHPRPGGFAFLPSINGSTQLAR